MGIYTELVLSTRVKNDPVVVSVIKFMLSIGDKPDVLPDHPLFVTPRWQWLLTCSSYYFVPRAMYLFEYDDIGKYWVLITRSDLKNYDDEIKHFVDWLRPYLDVEDEMIGYTRYEEAYDPTILFSGATK